MGELFDNVFNPQEIYETLFFNIKPVLNYHNLDDLLEKNFSMFRRWEYLAISKYNNKYSKNTKAQTIYEKHAVYYPEFTKIIAITYAKLYAEDGTLKRHMKKIVDNDEFVVLSTFINELHQISSDGVKSNPQYFPILCGHNILRHDIPLLIKRFILHRDKFKKNQKLPYILKYCLNLKPWESGVIDTVNVWKFNGYDNMSLMLIADFLGLKKTVDLLPLSKVSKTYWEMCNNNNSEDALKFISLQSATQTNFVIQIMNELRQL